MFSHIIPSSFSCTTDDLKEETIEDVKKFKIPMIKEESKSLEQIKSLYLKKYRVNSGLKWPFLVPEFIAANRSRWCSEQDPSVVMPRIMKIMLSAEVHSIMIDDYTLDIRVNIDYLPITMRLTLYETSYYAPSVRHPFLIECQKREGSWDRWYQFENILHECLPENLFGKLVNGTKQEQYEIVTNITDEARAKTLRKMIDAIKFECDIPSACRIRILLNCLPGEQNEALYSLMIESNKYPAQFLDLLFTGLSKEKELFFSQNDDKNYIKLYKQLAVNPLIETFINSISAVSFSSKTNYWQLEALNCVWKIVSVCMTGKNKEQFSIIGKRLITTLKNHAYWFLESNCLVDLEMQLQMNDIRYSAQMFVEKL